MGEQEKHYLEAIESFIESFGSIQRELVLNQEGLRAVVRFIEDFAGGPQAFSLDDPVMLKGRLAALTVIEELAGEMERIKEMEPPGRWKIFHETLLESVTLQLRGYREMARIFDDRELEHLLKGQELVNQGMGLLEGGERRPPRKG